MSFLREVIVYSRKGCHLCEIVKEKLTKLERRGGFRWREVDVETDDLLRRQFTDEVPVVFIDGRKPESNDPYPSHLLEKIEASDVLLLFWSRHAQQSKWVEREWQHGTHRAAHLVRGALNIPCGNIVVPLGAAPLAVLLFEIALNGISMFNHSNVRVAPAIERVLRWLVVTPDMHRVHHSILQRETDSNFGFNFPWWDRLFGTYRPRPEAGHEAMTLGIEQFRDSKELRLDRMLTQPFLDDPGKSQPVEPPADSSTNAS